MSKVLGALWKVLIRNLFILQLTDLGFLIYVFSSFIGFALLKSIGIHETIVWVLPFCLNIAGNPIWINALFSSIFWKAQKNEWWENWVLILYWSYGTPWRLTAKVLLTAYLHPIKIDFIYESFYKKWAWSIIGTKSVLFYVYALTLIFCSVRFQLSHTCFSWEN